MLSLCPISETHRPVCSCGAASVVHLQASDVFREGSNLIMFTSDVSARGMDYPEVSLVVQARPGPVFPPSSSVHAKHTAARVNAYVFRSTSALLILQHALGHARCPAWNGLQYSSGRFTKWHALSMARTI